MSYVVVTVSCGGCWTVSECVASPRPSRRAFTDCSHCIASAQASSALLRQSVLYRAARHDFLHWSSINLLQSRQVFSRHVDTQWEATGRRRVCHQVDGRRLVAPSVIYLQPAVCSACTCLSDMANALTSTYTSCTDRRLSSLICLCAASLLFVQPHLASGAAHCITGKLRHTAADADAACCCIHFRTGNETAS